MIHIPQLLAEYIQCKCIFFKMHIPQPRARRKAILLVGGYYCHIPPFCRGPIFQGPNLPHKIFQGPKLPGDTSGAQFASNPSGCGWNGCKLIKWTNTDIGMYVLPPCGKCVPTQILQKTLRLLVCWQNVISTIFLWFMAFFVGKSTRALKYCWCIYSLSLLQRGKLQRRTRGSRRVKMSLQVMVDVSTSTKFKN